MPFQVLTRAELITALEAVGIHSPFFELHPVDAVSSCKYHDIRNDVEAGCYPFTVFVDTYKQLLDRNTPFTFTGIRLLAQQTFQRAKSAREREIAKAWEDGLMV